MSSDRQLHLNLLTSSPGSAAGAWRREASNPLLAIQPDLYVHVAQLAEQGLFDALLLADRPHLGNGWDKQPRVRLDPLHLLTAASQHTEHLGLIGTVSTTWTHPYNIARAVGSLDYISGGRGGINVVTSYVPEIAKNFGDEGLPEKSVRYARADEYLEIVRSLWDTWSPDAIRADKESGVFADPSQVHLTHFEGEHFTVSGGSTVPPSPQGRPVVYQAGASPEGLRLAARFADGVFVSGSTRATIEGYRERLARAHREIGASRPLPLVFPGVILSLASTDEEARRRRLELDEYEDIDERLIAFAARIGVDPSDLDIDAPIPADKVRLDVQDGAGGDGLVRGSEGLVRSTTDLIRSGKSLRDILRAGTGHRTITGSPRTVADAFTEDFTSGLVDGFVVLLDVTSEDLPLLVEEVVPLLQQRGIYRTSYEGRTLRENLGLSVPTP